MENPGFYGIRTRILEYLDHQSLEKLCEIWTEDNQLRRTSWAKFMEEFGNREIFRETETETVRTRIPGWDEAVKKVGAEASLEELKEIKDSLLKNSELRNYCRMNPVTAIACFGSVKLMEFIFHTTYDLNSSFGDSFAPFALACYAGNLEMVRFMIRSSKEQGIDLNVVNERGETPFYLACCDEAGEAEPYDTAKLILENYEEFDIDIKKQDSEGNTALDHLREEFDDAVEDFANDDSIDLDLEECHKMIRLLEEEFAKIDASNPTD